MRTRWNRNRTRHRACCAFHLLARNAVPFLAGLTCVPAFGSAYNVVNVTAITGQNVSGPVTSWVIPDGDQYVEHLAGVNPAGDLIVFYFTPGANWKAINVTRQTARKVLAPVCHWQNRFGMVNGEYLAGRSGSGDLIVFCRITVNWTFPANWNAVNVSALTGQKIADAPTAWEAGGWNHVAAQGVNNTLALFHGGYDPTKWSAANLTSITQQSVKGRLVSWSTKSGAVITECVAGRSPAGDAVVWYFTPSSGWKAANLKLPGWKIAGAMDYFRSDGWNHLVGRDTSGKLFEFSGTQPDKWSAVNMEAIAGSVSTTVVGDGKPGWLSHPLRGEDATAVPTAYPVKRTTGNDRVVWTRNPDGALLLYWWTPSLDWQVMNVTEATGKRIASAPEGWVTPNTSGNSVMPTEHAAAEGEKNALLVFWGDGTPRRRTDSLHRSFREMRRLVGTRGRMAVILWNPNRPQHPAPSRAAIESAFETHRSYFRENSLRRYSIDNVAILPPTSAHESGWYPARWPASYYWQSENVHAGWNSPHVEKYAEAILAADPHFDYARYDTNKNKVLEADELRVCMIIPQNDAAGFVRECFSRQKPRMPLVVDGVMIPELFEAYIGNPPHATLVAHEASHSFLSASDMYMKDGSGYFYQPYAACAYSLMDQAVGHLDPFLKLKCGWLRPRIVFGTGTYLIPDAAKSGVAYVLMDPKRGADEYFMIENRSGYGFDDVLPTKGLAVWQIIEKGYETLGTPPYTDPKRWANIGKNDWGRRAIRLIRPLFGPNTISLNQIALWRAGGYQHLPSFHPDPKRGTLRWSDGTPSGFNIYWISNPGPVMTALITVP